MGRIDPAPPRPGRGPGSPAGWIVAGALAIALAALVAFQAGKRSKTGAVPATREPAAAAVPAPSVPPPASTSAPGSAAVDRVSPQPPELRFEHAVMEVTIPRPSPVRQLADEPPSTEPTPVPVETLHDKMARCLSFRVEDDEIHNSNPFVTQVRVMVANRCDFSFPGPEVWFEVRAVPLHSGGTSAREFGRFYAPIEARAGDETALVLACPRCYAVTHRLEVGLSWPPADGRQ